MGDFWAKRVRALRNAQVFDVFDDVLHQFVVLSDARHGNAGVPAVSDYVSQSDNTIDRGFALVNDHKLQVSLPVCIEAAEQLDNTGCVHVC